MMRSIIGFVCAVLVGIPWSAAYGAERIGVAGTVKSSVTGSIGGQTLPLNSGDAVYQQQVIAADGSGSAQLIFVDETVFNVGAGATVTLDEFVYDPNSSAGRVVLNVAQGAFRFISGSSLPSAYSITTPVATIGVRGTIFAGNVVSRNYMSLNLQQGQLVVCPEKGNRVEGNLSRQRPIREGNRDCTLIDPGEFRVGSGAESPPAGDPTIHENEPNESLDTLEPPIRCIIQFGVPVCN